MNSRILFVFLLVAYNGEQTQASQCVKMPECTKSKYVTGTCQNNVCTCVDGYVSTKYGCQEKIKPTLTATTTSENIPCSGEAVEGASITLHCSPDFPSAVYTWYHGNSAISGATSSSYFIRSFSSSDSGKYQCALELNGVKSDRSKYFDYHMLREDKESQVLPSLTGVPKTVFKHQNLSLACTNIPDVPTIEALRFSFHFDKKVIDTKSHYKYSYAVPDYTVNKIFCSVRLSTTMIYRDFYSEGIHFPSIADSITGVRIQGPHSPFLYRPSSWTCSIDGDGIVEPDNVSWTWQRNGRLLRETGKTLKIATMESSHDGIYTCTAKIGSLIQKSAKFHVEGVYMTLHRIGEPRNWFEAGYIKISCSVKSKSQLHDVITYRWKHNGKVLDGITDNVIQISKVDMSDAGSYTCETEACGLHLFNSTITFQPPSTSNTVEALQPKEPTAKSPKRPKLMKVSKVAEYSTGGNYTLMCKSPNKAKKQAFDFERGSTRLSQSKPTDKFSKYTIVNASPDDSGYYTCGVTINGEQSPRSKKVLIEIGPAGKYCTIEEASTMCAGDTFLGTCNDRNRCDCKQGYIPKGESCEYTLMKPVLKVIPDIYPGTVYMPGSIFTFFCSTSVRSAGTVFVFFKNGKELYRDSCGVYAISKASTTDSGEYFCNVASGILTSPESNSFHITVGVQLQSPTLVIRPRVVEYSAGADYTLTCKLPTTPLSEGVQFDFKKDGKLVGCKGDPVYRIINASAMHDGTYWCMATLNSQTAISNNQETITIGASGRYCTSSDSAEQCVGNGYNGACRRENRCCCKKGYVPKGDECKPDDATWWNIFYIS